MCVCVCVRACVRVCVCGCLRAEVCFDYVWFFAFLMGYILQSGEIAHKRVYYY